ncbi:MAG: hypothetical protein JF632_09020 [Acidobacteria bacterium]|nr:hypothetical protein [Acidobacteriota bacterium]
MRVHRTALFAVACMLAGSSVFVQTQRLAYPPTARGDVVDDYFGTKVPDPYRWMEDLDSKPVAGWVAAQNAVTEKYLAQLPLREKLRKRITELWNYPKVSTPFMEGGQVFYRRNSGLQKQSLFLMRPDLRKPARVLVDPNEMFPDGAIWRGRKTRKGSSIPVIPSLLPGKPCRRRCPARRFTTTASAHRNRRTA